MSLFMVFTVGGRGESLSGVRHGEALLEKSTKINVSGASDPALPGI
jgi:hypothetical protein